MNRWVPLVLALVLVFMTGCGTGEKYEEELDYANELGNTFGNMTEAAYIIEKDGWTYQNEGENYEYKLIRTNEKGVKETVAPMGMFTMNIIGDVIYGTTGEEGAIIKATLDGTKFETLVNGLCSGLMVTDKHMFFFRRSVIGNQRTTLYRTDLEGKNIVKLCENVQTYCLAGGWVFYANLEDEHRLYRVDTNGKDKVKMTDFCVTELNTDGAYVYGMNFDERNVFKMSLDGKGLKTLTEDDCWNLNLYNGMLYFRNNSRGADLYKMDTNGENMTLLAEGNIVRVILTENYVYCKDMEQDEGYFRIRHDGSNWELMD